MLRTVDLIRVFHDRHASIVGRHLVSSYGSLVVGEPDEANQGVRGLIIICGGRQDQRVPTDPCHGVNAFLSEDVPFAETVTDLKRSAVGSPLDLPATLKVLDLSSRPFVVERRDLRWLG